MDVRCESISMRWRGAGLTLLALALGACAGFDTSPVPEPSPVERLASFVKSAAFELPAKLRPCCAFGHSLNVQVVEVPVPMFEVQNVVNPEDLGEHTYNGGLVSLKNSPRQGFVSSEVNGLTYTCRGGFVDIAHVRDYADWTAFLALRIEGFLERGTLIELGDEAGERFAYVGSIDAATLQGVDRRKLAIGLAGWLAYQISIWHEVVTWYGWASVPMFPERASAFSPEDLYSNALGIQLAREVWLAHGVTSEAEFNAHLDAAIARELERLGAQPGDLSVAAADAVDGSWWDSGARLPDARLVLRRNFLLGPPILPWLIPAPLRPPALDEACANGQEPTPFEVADRFGSVVFSEHARFDVRVDTSTLDDDFPLGHESGWITQADLPRLTEAARTANLRSFGEGSDAP